MIDRDKYPLEWIEECREKAKDPGSTTPLVAECVTLLCAELEAKLGLVKALSQVGVAFAEAWNRKAAEAKMEQMRETICDLCHKLTDVASRLDPGHGTVAIAIKLVVDRTCKEYDLL